MQYRFQKKIRFLFSVSLCLFMLYSSPAFAVNKEIKVATLANKKTGLWQVYQYAKQYDTQLQSAQASWLATRELLPQAVAALLPNMGVTAASTYNRLHNNMTDMTYRYNTHGYALTLTQPLFNFSAFSAKQEADERVKAAVVTYAAAQQDLILRVMNAYVNVLLAEDTLHFKLVEQNSFAQQLKNAKVRYQVGSIAPANYYEAQAAYDQTRAAVITAENAISNARQQLRLITHIDPEKLLPFRSPLPLLYPTPQKISIWADFAEKNNFDYLVAHHAMQAAAADINVRRGLHLPTLNVVGTSSHNVSKFNIFGGPLNTDTRSIGLQLSIPIFSGGSVLSQTREARFLYDKSVAEREGASRRAKLGAEQLYRDIEAGIAKIKADKVSLNSALVSLRNVQLAYHAGNHTMADVLQSQEIYFSAQVQLAFDQYDYLNNTLALKKVAGTLCEADLQALDQWLVKDRRSAERV